MNTEELFSKYDGRLRAAIRRLGVTSEMDQEDIAQGVWIKLAARDSPPDSPVDWIFAVARHDVIRHGKREARRRAWSEAAAERRTAVSPRPFNIDQAIDAVRPRLSDREDQVMVAAMTSRTERDLARTLGYPTVKVAQTVRARLRTRIRDIVRQDVDVSFMFELLEGTASAKPVEEPVLQPLPEIQLETLQASEPSPRYGQSTLERLSAVQTLVARVDDETEPAAWFGSFSDRFAQAAGAEDAASLWARALGLPGDEIERLVSGERTLLELDPDTAALAGMLLGLGVDDAIGLGLADVGLRPVLSGEDAGLKEEILPSEEAAVRVSALRAEDNMLRA